MIWFGEVTGELLNDDCNARASNGFQSQQTRGNLLTRREPIYRMLQVSRGWDCAVPIPGKPSRHLSDNYGVAESALAVGPIRLLVR